ncbi:MAG: MFS transporter, partial [Methanobacteriota archaeon]
MRAASRASSRRCRWTAARAAPGPVRIPAAVELRVGSARRCGSSSRSEYTPALPRNPSSRPRQKPVSVATTISATIRSPSPSPANWDMLNRFCRAATSGPWVQASSFRWTSIPRAPRTPTPSPIPNAVRARTSAAIRVRPQAVSTRTAGSNAPIHRYKTKPKRIVMAALPGRYWVRIGISRRIVSLRAGMSTWASARRRTPTPYIIAPIHAIPKAMWKNRRTRATGSAMARAIRGPVITATERMPPDSGCRRLGGCGIGRFVRTVPERERNRTSKLVPPWNGRRFFRDRGFRPASLRKPTCPSAGEPTCKLVPETSIGPTVERSSGGATSARGSKGALSIVLVTVLLDSVGFSMVMPVMPVLIEGLTGEGLSAAATWGGWLLVVFAVTQFAFAPLLGNLSDRYGRRPVLLYSLFAFGIDYMIMGLSPTIAWLFLGRIMSGIPGASFTAATAYVADVSSPESRAKNFGLVGSASASGFVIGPAFGGLLGLLGPRAPFFAASVLAFVNFAFGFFVLKESLARGSRREFSWRRANPIGGLRQIRKYPQVMGLAFALMLWWLAIQAYPTTWSFYTMFRFGWSQAAIGLSLAAYGAVIAFSQARLPQIVLPRLGERRTVVVGLLLAALAFVGQSLATEGWQVFAWVPVW